MLTWKRATNEVVNSLEKTGVYVAIYDGGKVGKFSGGSLQIAHGCQAVILDWIVEMPI